MDVVIATYGKRHWAELARHRAAPSARPQARRLIFVHGETLASARNEGLERVDSEFVIFLDSDDQLEQGYVRAMQGGSADLRAPSVAYVRDGRRHHASVPRVVGHDHDCTGPCLEEGNFIAIGAAVRTELLRSVGGFKEEPIWEDWAAWLRCYRAGATVETISEAVYRAHVARGRNDQLTKAERVKVFREIAA